LCRSGRHAYAHTDTDGYASGYADTHTHHTAHTDAYPSGDLDTWPNDYTYANRIAYTHPYGHASSVAGTLTPSPPSATPIALPPAEVAEQRPRLGIGIRLRS